PMVPPNPKFGQPNLQNMADPPPKKNRGVGGTFARPLVAHKRPHYEPILDMSIDRTRYQSIEAERSKLYKATARSELNLS
ncbi:MAG: hypothetical protein LH628_00095, partial [Microcoleus sp. CAN_BIN18]|nr:hypothetical protein [Microcoleus sp. CAN_BIN18]